MHTSTSTTDAHVIKQDSKNKKQIVQFDINGSKFYYPVVASQVPMLASNDNPSVIIDQNTATCNIPIVGTSTTTTTTLYSKSDVDKSFGLNTSTVTTLSTGCATYAYVASNDHLNTISMNSYYSTPDPDSCQPNKKAKLTNATGDHSL